MRDAETFIRGIFSRVTRKGLDSFTEEEIRTTIEEFSRPGTAEAVPRYFRDNVSEDVQAGLRSMPWNRLTMPLLAIQPDSDPLQPLYQFENVTEVIPGCEKLVIIKDSGHFTPAEQPQQVTKAILDFFR
jgi:pimeloyl-ACP methyl ester carboxylesterase